MVLKAHVQNVSDQGPDFQLLHHTCRLHLHSTLNEHLSYRFDPLTIKASDELWETHAALGWEAKRGEVRERPERGIWELPCLGCSYELPWCSWSLRTSPPLFLSAGLWCNFRAADPRGGERRGGGGRAGNQDKISAEGLRSQSLNCGCDAHSARLALLNRNNFVSVI